LTDDYSSVASNQTFTLQTGSVISRSLPLPEMTNTSITAQAIAIIPARGGSKGIAGKNLKRVGGVSLVARAVGTALRAATVDRVIVSTDDDAIAAEARAAGAEVVARPVEIAGDAASSESAVLHCLAAIDGVPAVTVMVQATSPFITPSDIDDAVRRVASGECDSVFAAVPSHEFLWREADGGMVGVNHDHTARPRRQDREPQLRETGAFYAMRTSGLRRSGFRFFGRIGAQLVDPRTAIEIDDPSDLRLARSLAPLLADGEPIDVDALVMDFDGVHTDNAAIVSVDGGEQVRVDRSDGLGIALLRGNGLPMLILSTERHPVVASRASKLGVDVLQGLDDKAVHLLQWATDHGLDLDRIAYVGNDVNDIDCLRLVGWPIVVADAQPAVLPEARVVLGRNGGHGAIRELADRILTARLGTRVT
jgi:YrbI family 3-deoxy-D-manno-octulosonate 8-phosphate phosphatase